MGENKKIFPCMLKERSRSCKCCDSILWHYMYTRHHSSRFVVHITINMTLKASHTTPIIPLRFKHLVWGCSDTTDPSRWLKTVSRDPEHERSGDSTSFNVWLALGHVLNMTSNVKHCLPKHQLSCQVIRGSNYKHATRY
jgi:hypothetical protein